MLCPSAMTLIFKECLDIQVRALFWFQQSQLLRSRCASVAIHNADTELVITRMYFHSDCTASGERGYSLTSSQFSSEVVWIALQMPVSSSRLSKSLKWLLLRSGTLQDAWTHVIHLEKNSLVKYFLTGLFLLKWLSSGNCWLVSLTLGAGKVRILLGYSIGN